MIKILPRLLILLESLSFEQMVGPVQPYQGLPSEVMIGIIVVDYLSFEGCLVFSCAFKFPSLFLNIYHLLEVSFNSSI